MASIVLNGDTSGSVTLSPPAVAGTQTVTIPAATGTVMVSGNMPAFSAYAGSATSLSNNTFTKVLFDTEEFDTNNNFASSRFTPTVAGYYQINSVVAMASGTYKSQLGIYKNGSVYKYGIYPNQVTVDTAYSVISSLVYLNGSTDYVEIYAYQTSGGALATATSSPATWFNGCLVRSA